MEQLSNFSQVIEIEVLKLGFVSQSPQALKEVAMLNY